VRDIAVSWWRCWEKITGINKTAKICRDGYLIQFSPLEANKLNKMRKYTEFSFSLLLANSWLVFPTQLWQFRLNNLHIFKETQWLYTLYSVQACTRQAVSEKEFLIKRLHRKVKHIVYSLQKRLLLDKSSFYSLTMLWLKKTTDRRNTLKGQCHEMSIF
jgi:hypothetical protein